jgi:hypothetical protein
MRKEHTMRPAPFDGRPVALPRGTIVTLPDAAGLRIACLRGCVWLTVDDDPRDIVLERGETYTPTVHKRVMFHALEASCIAAQAEVTATARRALPGPLLRLLDGAMRRALGDNRAHESTRDAPATTA